MIRNIKLTASAGETDCRVDGSNLVLKPCFLKKAWSWPGRERASTTAGLKTPCGKGKKKRD